MWADTNGILPHRLESERTKQKWWDQIGVEKIGDIALNEKMNHKKSLKETGTSVEINMRLGFQRFELFVS